MFLRIQITLVLVSPLSKSRQLSAATKRRENRLPCNDPDTKTRFPIYSVLNQEPKVQSHVDERTNLRSWHEQRRPDIYQLPVPYVPVSSLSRRIFSARPISKYRPSWIGAKSKLLGSRAEKEVIRQLGISSHSRNRKRSSKEEKAVVNARNCLKLGGGNTKATVGVSC